MSRALIPINCEDGPADGPRLTWLRARLAWRGEDGPLTGEPVDTFDFRSLNPPEPLNRALAIADRLLPGESAVVLTPFWPAPLLDALRDRRLLRHATMRADGGCEIHLEAPRGED